MRTQTRVIAGVMLAWCVGGAGRLPDGSAAPAAGGPQTNNVLMERFPAGLLAVRPLYPPEALSRGIQGTGVLHLHTGPDNKVVQARMVRSTGSALLDETSVKTALETWQGAPNRDFEVPITFQIAGGSRSPAAAARPGPGAAARAPETTEPRRGASPPVSVLTRAMTVSYPLEARRRGLEGNGVVAVRTGADGWVKQAWMVHSTGAPILDENTVQMALRTWRGSPNHVFAIPVRYQLQHRLLYPFGSTHLPQIVK